MPADPVHDPGLRLRAVFRSGRAVPGIAGGVVAGFLMLPILVILPTAFTTGNFIGMPKDGVSLQWFARLVDDPAWLSAFLLSVRIAGTAALLATVLGTAASLGLTRLRRGSEPLRALMIAPLIVPYVVYALGLADVVERLAVALDSTWPIVVGQAVLAFPLVFVVVSAGLSRVDPAQPRAAESLGARWPTVVRRIELPAIRVHVVVAAVFAFAFCFDQVEVALFLSTPSSTTLPVLIFSTAREAASPVIGAASIVVIAVAALLAAVLAGVTRLGRTD
ncbi:ABC transporter permease [Pseudonocardia alni]|uniref:ABC transporter permease n=1 Tax=Pseudonocardia alni TaxID=33907 RepID=UPI0033FA00CF